METTPSTILRVMNVIFWVLFIGLCIKTGAILVSFAVSLFVNAEGAKDLYQGLDLSELYHFNRSLYIQTVSLFIALTGLKAYIAYLVVKVFLKFKLARPFSQQLVTLFSKVSYYAVGAGIIALIASGHSKFVLKKGIAIPLHWGSEEILFFAGVIYILALIFKKGAELQAENDLTV
ncbi:DUF2975 domain-containing protein [Rufibacter sp. H-1]|uniref:DUF2975 domain-containing protein n=1 Tax=Rufibacter sediminis TaxID=2762756 RepID=A0ABR6VUJ5_9BACT|nr:DUF2975 domain-containing protein [Rufibacter sediminis]MBC3540871.1 DUF2975 domain-containing protein [Rufibacter sediminis]